MFCKVDSLPSYQTCDFFLFAKLEKIRLKKEKRFDDVETNEDNATEQLLIPKTEVAGIVEQVGTC